MPKKHLAIRSCSLLALVLGVLTGFALFPFRSDAQLGCPPVSNNGWTKCATVYYTITGFDGAQTPQINSALSTWGQANFGNNSHVRFLNAAPPPNAENYGTLTVQTGATVSGAPAETVKDTRDGPIADATITFDLENIIPGTSPPQLVYDPGVVGYNSIFTKVTLHEAGHTMGLKDEPQGAGLCFGQSAEPHSNEWNLWAK